MAEEEINALPDRVRCHKWWEPFIYLFRAAQPDPVIEPPEADTPERVMRREAAAAGIRILDLRGHKRNAPHPFRHHCVVRDGKVLSLAKKHIKPGDEDFGIWGWFGGGKNKPTRGRAHGKLKWDKCSTTVEHTMAVDAGPARLVGVPVQNAIANDATIVLLHSIIARCWASHSANGFSDSFEISGKGTCTDKQAVAAKILLKYIIASKKRNAKTRKKWFIIPHAFSHWSRPKDCGPEPWVKVAVWAMATLGLILGPVVGSGKQPKWVEGTPSNKKAA